MKKPAAFTLLETLVSLGLFLLLLAIFSTTLQGSLSMMRHADEHDQAALRGTEALQKIVTEISESTQLLSPMTSGPSSQVRFVKTDMRLAPLPDPPPAVAVAWNPLASSAVVKVTFKLQDGKLVRSIEWPDGSLQSFVVLEGMLGFSFDKLDPVHFRVSLDFEGRTHLKLESEGFFRCQ